MAKSNPFFDSRNIIRSISEEDFAQSDYYLEAVKAFARTTYKSIYVIDYHEQGFTYVSDNPLFLCGYTAEEVRDMGYEFYNRNVPAEDLEMLLKINNIGFDFYGTIPLEERKKYTISYDFHLKNSDEKKVLINQKLTPLFINKEGKIWKAICIVSLSSQQHAGNITIYKHGGDKQLEYDLKEDVWKTIPKIQLTQREKEVLRYSVRGFTINEIGSSLFVSPDTVKYHRRKIFEKLDVTNMTEAISYVTMNKLI